MEFQTEQGPVSVRDRIAQMNRQIAASLDAHDWARARALVEAAHNLASKITERGA